MNDQPARPHWHPARYGWTLGVLVLGWLLTLTYWQQHRTVRREQTRAYFDYRSQDALQRIQQRLGYYEQALLAARGLFAANNGVTKQEFAAFVATLQVGEHYPGIQGIGFALLVAAVDKERHLAQIRNQGFPEYQLRPEQKQAVYSTIVYLEPFNSRNLRAFGYDMLTEPVRQAAMNRARDLDRISMSGKVRLVQETEQDIQSGFLVYVPVFRNGLPSLTLEERRRNLLGWVYAPFRMNDLLQGVFGGAGSDLAIRIFDGEEANRGALLYEREAFQVTGTEATLQAQQTLTFADHAWTIQTRAMPSMLARQGSDLSTLILVVGGLGSLLLAGYTFFLMKQFHASKALNQSLTRSLAELGQAQASLQESEQSFRTLSNSGEALIWTSGPDMLCDYFNEPWLTFTGRTLEQELGNGWAEGVHPDDLARCLDVYVQAFDRRESFSMDYRLHHASGDYRWLVDRGTPRHDSQGRFLGYIGHCLDITQQKIDAENLRSHGLELELQAEELRRAQGELEAGRERYFSLYDLAPVGYCTLSEQGLILESNLSAAVLLGMRRKELLKQPLSRFIPKKDQAMYYQHREQVLRTGLAAAWEQRMLDRDGAELWALVTATSTPVADGTPGLRVVLSDITQRKRVEQALRVSEETFRILVETAQELIWKCDAEGRFTYLNPAWERTHGHPVEAMLGRGFGGFQRPEVFARDLQEFSKLMTGGVVRDYETTHVARDGQEVTLLFNAVPSHDWEGRIIGSQGTATDISHRKRVQEHEHRMEAQQHRFEKMESLGTMASGVAHDMNNVLAAILGLASAHIADQPNGSPTHHALDTISQAAVRGGKVVKTLLSFARTSPLEEREVDMNEVIREEVDLLIHSTLAKVQLKLDLAADLRVIRGDATALTHAVMNLCVNAVDAMPEHGHLTLRTRNVDNHWIEVRVEDSGYGMSKEVQEKALDPFFTTKPVDKGTGLGLALVHSTVKAHRGHLELISKPGQGTCVRLRFPACEPAIMGPQMEPEPAEKTPRTPLCVLVVDDDQMTQQGIQTILKALGHSYTARTRGEDALALLQDGFQPDVVILDLNMPGLGGSGTLPRLRALRPTLPILLVTGRADQTAIDLAAAHPGVTLLAKPFSLVELEQYLEPIMRNTAGRTPIPQALGEPGDSRAGAEPVQHSNSRARKEPDEKGVGLKQPFTAAGIRACTTTGTFGDGGGLYLQVAPRKPPLTGVTKSWVFRYRDLVTGRPREMGLGAAWDLSLQEARESAKAQQALLGTFKDPIATRKAQRAEDKTTPRKQVE